MKHISYHQYILILLTLTFFACGGKKSADSTNADSQKGLVTFHLNAPPSSVEPLMLSELADSVSYVALETTKETLTQDGVQYGDRFYTATNNKILCFNKDGKYMHQVGNLGKGPEEYLYPPRNDYFRVDATNNWVYCYSSDNRAVVYDENGRYVKSLKGKYVHDPIRMVYNHLIYVYDENTYNINIIDGLKNEKVNTDRMSKTQIDEKKKYLKELRDKNKVPGQNQLGMSTVSPPSSSDAYFRFGVLECDTVFEARGKEVRPLCLIIQKNKYVPEDKYNNAYSFLLRPLVLVMHVLKGKLLLYVRYYSSMDQCKPEPLYISQSDRVNYWVLCDLKDGSVTYYTNYIVNDLDGGPNIVTRKNIYCLSVEDLKNDEEVYKGFFSEGVKAKLKDQEGKFQRLLESLANDANPIIRTIHWKQ